MLYSYIRHAYLYSRRIEETGKANFTIEAADFKHGISRTMAPTTPTVFYTHFLGTRSSILY